MELGEFVKHNPYRLAAMRPPRRAGSAPPPMETTQVQLERVRGCDSRVRSNFPENRWRASDWEHGVGGFVGEAGARKRGRERERGGKSEAVKHTQWSRERGWLRWPPMETTQVRAYPLNPQPSTLDPKH